MPQQPASDFSAARLRAGGPDRSRQGDPDRGSSPRSRVMCSHSGRKHRARSCGETRTPNPRPRIEDSRYSIPLRAYWSGEPHDREPDECSAVEWFPLGNLPDDVIPYPAGVCAYLDGVSFRLLG